jgi:integrin alpha 7
VDALKKIDLFRGGCLHQGLKMKSAPQEVFIFTILIDVQENTRDIQSPIKFRLSYSLIQEEPQPIITGEALPSVDRYPILNQQEAVRVFQANFQKDCGDNEICESNLEVHAELQLPQSNFYI